MDQDRAFFEAIKEHPDDDLHRLAWADWLEEHDDVKRATFLRHQLRLTTLDEADPARDALEDEADDLLAVEENEWAGKAGLLSLDWRWRRGMIEHVTVDAATFLEHGEELFDVMPIRQVRLLVEADDLARLGDSPLLERIERLELGGSRDDSPFASAYLRDRALLPFLTSPYLARLTELDLTGQGLEGAAIQALIDTGLMSRLRVLELAGNKAIGDRVLRQLAVIQAPRMERLSLGQTNVTAHGLRDFLSMNQWPRLRALDVNAGMLFRQAVSPELLRQQLLRTPVGERLTSLWVHGITLDPACVREIVEGERKQPWEELRLTSCELREPEASILAGTASLAGLRRLQLRDNHLHDSGCRALVGGAPYPKLVELDVSNNHVAGPGLRALLAAPGMGRLLRLDVSRNYVGTPGLEALTRTTVPRRLTWLHLGVANLNDESLRVLSDSLALSRLRVLWLNGNRLGDKGVEVLAYNPHLPRLQQVHLDGTDVDSPGAEALLETPYLARVRQLSMRGAYITRTERDRLVMRYGPATQF